MKKILKKVLEPIGIWGILRLCKRIKCKIQHRLYARKFAPLFGKSKLIIQDSYTGKYKNLSHSQSGQEQFIYEQIFHEKETGIFVEVGGNDPVILSNTYTLEKLGWKGISFEPVASLCEKWEHERTTKCYPYVIGDREDWVDFEEVINADEWGNTDYGSHVMSSVAGYGRLSASHQFVTAKKRMRKLENVLRENNVENVDILFVDVEGFEINVIKGINFENVNIKCICIENPPFTEEGKELRYLLHNKGYALKAHIGCDDIFLRE